jgi:hypothetical protein
VSCEFPQIFSIRRFISETQQARGHVTAEEEEEEE